MRTFVLAATLSLALSTTVHALPLPTSPLGPDTSTRPATIGARIDALATKTGQRPRDRRAQVAIQLTRLGPAAENEILARLEHDSPAMAALRGSDPSAASAFDAALLHAIGELKTARALPALTRAFEHSTDLRVQKAAGDGLGKLCGLGGDDALKKHARPGDVRAHVAYASLGLCRTNANAGFLAANLASAPEADVAPIAQGLGFLGSTWAWEALGPSRAAEGLEIRTVCSKALVGAHTHRSGQARAAIAKALKMVDPNAARRVAK